MVDFEKEKIESMIKGMTVEEKVVAWNVLKDDKDVIEILSNATTEDAGNVTINRLLDIAKRKVNK